MQLAFCVGPHHHILVYIAQTLQHASAALSRQHNMIVVFTDRFPHAHVCLTLATALHAFDLI